MINWFYKCTPIILCTAGLLPYLFMLLLNKNFYDAWNWPTWVVIISSQILLLALCGRLIQRLYRAAFSDHLTRLGNRRCFQSKLEAEMNKVKKYNFCLSIVMVDIDNFKSINDNYGHAAGDAVLKNISKVFLSNVRKTDTIIRWGGDEFAILLPRANSHQAAIFSERIRKAVEQKFSDYTITVSVGMITIKEDLDLNKILLLTDQALYKAKETKNAVVKIVS